MLNSRDEPIGSGNASAFWYKPVIQFGFGVIEYTRVLGLRPRSCIFDNPSSSLYNLYLMDRFVDSTICTCTNRHNCCTFSNHPSNNSTLSAPTTTICLFRDSWWANPTCRRDLHQNACTYTYLSLSSCVCCWVLPLPLVALVPWVFFNRKLCCTTMCAYMYLPTTDKYHSRWWYVIGHNHCQCHWTSVRRLYNC